MLPPKDGRNQRHANEKTVTPGAWEPANVAADVEEALGERTARGGVTVAACLELHPRRHRELHQDRKRPLPRGPACLVCAVALRGAAAPPPRLRKSAPLSTSSVPGGTKSAVHAM